MKLRHRPWKLLGFALVTTLTFVVLGFDLLDGEVISRRLGQVTFQHTPIRFGLVVLVDFLAGAFMLLLWVSLWDEWNRDYSPRVKPPLDNPDHRQPL